MNRRTFLRTTAASLASTTLLSKTAFSQSKRTTTTTTTTAPANLTWHDVRDWGVEGRGFDDTAAFYDRLPARAQGKVPGPVWHLSRQTAGMLTDFQTDADAIHVRYRLNSDTLALAHMPATGVSGVDLYAKAPFPPPTQTQAAGTGRVPEASDSADDTSPRAPEWHWLAISRPKSRDVYEELINQLPRANRTYRLHLPLYNGVESLAIGLPKSASFTALPPRAAKPVVYYGTSIAQGACASRPGMAYTNILARRLNNPFLNLGFSGSGKMEIEVGQFISELDAAVFVLDCLPNCTPEITAERTQPLVQLLRKNHPTTPILLVEDRTADNAFLRPDLQRLHAARRAAYRKAYQSLLDAGTPNLHYLPGDNLLGHDGEATTDGSHPNDLGMVRYADALEPTLRKLLA